MGWTGATSFRHLALGVWDVNSCPSAGNGMEVEMDTQHIDGMVRRLGPVLKDKSKAERILKKYWRDKMALVWSVQDVYRAANEREVAMTNEEAMKILQTLLNQHNKQYGIKWEDLVYHIEDQVLGRKLTKQEFKRFINRDNITINQ
jgi:hypothetical protein